MNLSKENKKKTLKGITFCVKCQSGNISTNDEGYYCHDCGTNGIVEWYKTSEEK